MTKPDWCPADVWDRAKTCVFGMMPVMDDEELFGNVKRVARAILAERERALEEAAQCAEWPRIACSSSEYSDGFNNGCDTAAALIRALKETP